MREVVDPDFLDLHVVEERLQRPIPGDARGDGLRRRVDVVDRAGSARQRVVVVPPDREMHKRRPDLTERFHLQIKTRENSDTLSDLPELRGLAVTPGASILRDIAT